MLGSTRESLVNSKKDSDVSLKQPCEMLRFFSTAFYENCTTTATQSRT